MQRVNAICIRHSYIYILNIIIQAFFLIEIIINLLDIVQLQCAGDEPLYVVLDRHTSIHITLTALQQADIYL